MMVRTGVVRGVCVSLRKTGKVEVVDEGVTGPIPLSES